MSKTSLALSPVLVCVIPTMLRNKHGDVLHKISMSRIENHMEKYMRIEHLSPMILQVDLSTGSQLQVRSTFIQVPAGNRRSKDAPAALRIALRQPLQ